MAMEYIGVLVHHNLITHLVNILVNHHALIEVAILSEFISDTMHFMASVYKADCFLGSAHTGMIANHYDFHIKGGPEFHRPKYLDYDSHFFVESYCGM